MGLFKDFEQLTAYEREYCDRCLHRGAVPEANTCPVYQLHLGHGINVIVSPATALLDAMIPLRDSEETVNDECRLFVNIMPPIAPIDGYNFPDALGFHSHNVGAPLSLGGPPPGATPTLPTHGYWRHVHDDGDIPHRHELTDVYDPPSFGGSNSAEHGHVIEDSNGVFEYHVHDGGGKFHVHDRED